MTETHRLGYVAVQNTGIGRNHHGQETHVRDRCDVLPLYLTAVRANGRSGSQLWYESTLNLYKTLEAEKRDERQKDISSVVSQFIVFCIELYRRAHKGNAPHILSLFRDKGVLKFLTDGFETLHSQSQEYILREIDSYLKNRSK